MGMILGMSTNSFNPVPTQPDLPTLDKDVQKLWSSKQISQKIMQPRGSAKPWVFYDGPPGTNGKPHIGHIMQSSLKDVWPRFKTMQGYWVMRKAGWDTHGLPIELTAEAELGISGKRDIEKFGVTKFINYCRDTVLRFRQDWVDAITKLGRSVDFENDYLTMSNEFIQSDWWILKQAFTKGLMYKDYKILPYCCRCGTGLSSHEVAQGYQDVSDLTITAKFKLADNPAKAVLAWTTTPWTLLGNVALCVGDEIAYVEIKQEQAKNPEETLILAEGALERLSKKLGSYSIVNRFTGKDLVGKTYIPLWQHEAGASDITKSLDNGKELGSLDIYKIVSDSFVTTEDGTGVVHLALYGDDDFRLIKKFGIKRVQHVAEDGQCGASCGQYAGRFFREESLAVDIVKDLAARDLLFDKYRYEHSYPHCWRCKTPLMYFARSSWFLRTSQLKEQMLAENSKINWQPPHIQTGRFGNWLENNVDWAISRERYWGSPLNIWTNQEDPNDQICPSSLRELRELGAYFEKTGEPLPSELDLHIHVLDDVVIKNDKGQLYRREKGVLDCWFNAGAMPWGQHGYPEKPGSEEIFAQQYPADFICEAIDQTRGWFYTLLAVSTIVNGKSSFKNVICTELILDANGKKMSKSLGNVIPPVPLIDKYGADAVRWTFYESDPWQVKRYSEELPKEALRSVIIPIWNCYSFFVTYALIDNWKPSAQNDLKSCTLSELDRWLLSALAGTINEVTSALESFDVSRASHKIAEFVEGLSNWYIRRSRRRFWKSEDDRDKNAAYVTLYETLTTLASLIAPLCPFLSEAMYQNLVRQVNQSAPESVHLTDWPDSNRFPRAEQLEKETAIIQETASLGRALRVEHDLKVRQPLQRLTFAPKDRSLVAGLTRHLDSLAEELNVKKVEVVEDASSFVQLVGKPNWRGLGPKLGDKMKQAAPVIMGLTAEQLETLDKGMTVDIKVAGATFALGKEDVVIEHKASADVVVHTGKSVSVALSTEITTALAIEGDARELVSIIQRHRKSSGLDIADRINLGVSGGPKLEEAVASHKDYIQRECLATTISAPAIGATNYDMNGEAIWVSVEVAS